jgi:outer membrane protein assembly factor BamB
MRTRTLALCLLALCASAQTPQGEDWTVWGGKNRDFQVASPALAESWPAAGPKKLWSRPLGDGYSAIAVEKGVLYTAFRRDTKDVVTALEAATGKTLWEFEHENPFKNMYWQKVGPGPYAMPQVFGDRVLTASGTGKIFSLEKKTGKAVWSHDLYKEFGATELEFGYSCHPLLYKDTLIYLLGGTGSAVVALRPSDGKVAWKALSFKNGYSSPLLIDVDGQPQVAALLADEVIGFSPDDGKQYWSYPHKTNLGMASSTPVWAPGNMLFISCSHGLGARVLQLNQSGGSTAVKQLWFDARHQLNFGSAILRDGIVYFSSGDNGPGIMTAVDLKTGDTKWRERGFGKAQLIYADGKIILADEDGALALFKPTPEKFELLTKATVLESISWTPPTLAGTRLYWRDRKTIAAFELGR